MNILIVAYSFPPDKKVGALRAGYWFNNLPSLMKANVQVITAEHNATNENVFVVPKEGSSLFEKLIKDEGLIWKKNIQEFLVEEKINKPDVVIITGSPFMHFSLANLFKKKYSAKVILDYRDPFAQNPGFNNGGLKVALKKWFERKFNRQSDALVTVNSYCAQLIEKFDSKPNTIVQNGYDETFVPDLKQVNLTSPSFSYTGKYYFDPTPFVQAVEEQKCILQIAGPSSLEKKFDDQYIKENGFVTYNEAVQLIADSDVGIIQTYGEDFQSTTKIFDYIRCKRAILIVSNKYIERGSIHEELKGYPNVFWSKNDSKSIGAAIETIKSHTYVEPDLQFAEKFSRKNQTLKLIELIEKIT